MFLKEDIKPYLTVDGYVCPNVVPPNTIRGSGNQVMYTSEYYILLKQNNELTERDVIEYNLKIEDCISLGGLLNRAPVGQTADQESFDDYLGVLNACKQLGITSVPRVFLQAFLGYCGFMNNNLPGEWTRSSFLARNPAFVASFVGASAPSLLNPLHLLLRLVFFPAFFATAIMILWAAFATDATSADGWRLMWHITGATRASLMCRLAAVVWRYRMRRVSCIHWKDLLELKVPERGMAAVAKMYYSEGHPFVKYWRE